mgnify:CR=1 FL=1
MSCWKKSLSPTIGFSYTFLLLNVLSTAAQELYSNKLFLESEDLSKALVLGISIVSVILGSPPNATLEAAGAKDLVDFLSEKLKNFFLFFTLSNLLILWSKLLEVLTKTKIFFSNWICACKPFCIVPQISIFSVETFLILGKEGSNFFD